MLCTSLAAENDRSHSQEQTGCFAFEERGGKVRLRPNQATGLAARTHQQVVVSLDLQ